MRRAWLGRSRAARHPAQSNDAVRRPCVLRRRSARRRGVRIRLAARLVRYDGLAARGHGRRLPVSPAGFSHSVHNTQAGLFSIWANNPLPSTGSAPKPSCITLVRERRTRWRRARRTTRRRSPNARCGAGHISERRSVLAFYRVPEKLKRACFTERYAELLRVCFESDYTATGGENSLLASGCVMMSSAEPSQDGRAIDRGMEIHCCSASTA